MPEVREYSLTVQEKDLGLTWQYVTNTWDEKAAIAWATREMRKFACCDWVKELILRDDDGVVATFRIDEIAVAVRHNRWQGWKNYKGYTTK